MFTKPPPRSGPVVDWLRDEARAPFQLPRGDVGDQVPLQWLPEMAEADSRVGLAVGALLGEGDSLVTDRLLQVSTNAAMRRAVAAALAVAASTLAAIHAAPEMTSLGVPLPSAESGHTAAYGEFMYSFNGGLEFKDDLDLDAYGRCTPTEKAKLDRLLELKLRDGDPRVARAIAAIRPTDASAMSDGAAIDALRAALFDEHASADSRLAAAVALAQIDGAPANASLKAALDEPVPELQRRAAELLFHRLELDEQATNDASGAAVLHTLLRHADDGVRGAAVTELKRVVDSGSAAMAGYGGGATPPSLAALAVRAGK